MYNKQRDGNGNRKLKLGFQAMTCVRIQEPAYLCMMHACAKSFKNRNPKT